MDQSLTWSTATLLTAVSNAGGNVSESTFNQWMNAANQPSSLPHALLNVLTTGEKEGWWTLFLESLKRNKNTAARRELYRQWKARQAAETARRQSNPAYQSFITQFEKSDAANRAQREQDLAQQEASLRQQMNLLREDVRAALDRATALRNAGDLAGAQATLALIEAARSDDMDFALQIREGGVRIAQERGRLAHDLGLSAPLNEAYHDFVAALAHYGRALNDTPIGQSEDATRIRRLMARSLREAMRTAPDFDTGFDLITQHQTNGAASDRSIWHLIMLRSPDMLAARLVMRQMSRAGAVPDVATWSIAMLFTADFEEGENLLIEMKAASVAPDVITFNTLLDKAKDFAEGATVLTMMAAVKPDAIAPNVATSTTIATKVTNIEEATMAVRLMLPHRVAGKEFLRVLAVSLAKLHPAEIILEWAAHFCSTFSVPGYYTDAFNTVMKTYRRHDQRADVLCISIAYPHLPEAATAMLGWKEDAVKYYSARLDGDFGAEAMHALARLYDCNGESEPARHWAERTVRHPNFSTFHPNRQIDVKRML